MEFPGIFLCGLVHGYSGCGGRIANPKRCNQRAVLVDHHQAPFRFISAEHVFFHATISMQCLLCHRPLVGAASLYRGAFPPGRRRWGVMDETHSPKGSASHSSFSCTKAKCGGASPAARKGSARTNAPGTGGTVALWPPPAAGVVRVSSPILCRARPIVTRSRPAASARGQATAIPCATAAGRRRAGPAIATGRARRCLSARRPGPVRCPRSHR